MRKIFGLLSVAALTFVLAACEKSSDDRQSEAVITSFSIGDFKMIFNDITIDGKDTVAVSTVSGTTVKFSIDQQHNLIFNSDSLPVGSQLDSVTTKISGAEHNQGYEIDMASLEGSGLEVRFTDVASGTVAGIENKADKVLGTMFYPVGAPGPKDCEYLMDNFISMMEEMK